MLRLPTMDELDLQALERKEVETNKSVARLKAMLRAKEAELRAVSTARERTTARTARGSMYDGIGGLGDATAAADMEDGSPEMQLFDQRGRAVYGAAWDEAEDGGLPLREVMQMNPGEAEELREEALKMLEMIKGRKVPRMKLSTKSKAREDVPLMLDSETEPDDDIAEQEHTAGDSTRVAAGVPSLDLSQVRTQFGQKATPSTATAKPKRWGGFRRADSRRARPEKAVSAAPSGDVSTTSPATGAGMSRLELALSRGAEYRARQANGGPSNGSATAASSVAVSVTGLDQFNSSMSVQCDVLDFPAPTY